MKKPLNLAHRGFSGLYPENSKRAFTEALAVAGCDGFETDVHLSKDGQPVIIHDATLDRTSDGKGAVGAKTFKELQEYDIGAWKDAKFAGERIMHLDELLELAVEHGKALNIELKNYEVLYPNLEQIVIDRVVAKKATDLVFFSSFNHISMEMCMDITQEIPTGLLYMQPLIRAEEYASGHNLHPNFRLFGLEADLIERAHKLGIAVNAWTVDEPEDYKLCIKLGVDSIITNFPDRLAEILH